MKPMDAMRVFAPGNVRDAAAAARTSRLFRCVALAAALAVVGLSLASCASVPGATPVPGRLVITPPTFPDTKVGDTTGGALTITNVGNVAVTITNLILGGINPGDFPIVGTPTCFIISPGSSCGIGFQFAPSAAGQRTATYTVVSDGVGSPQTVKLTSNGVAATMLLTLTPSPKMVFPDTVVGSTSATQTLTMTNSGNSDFVVRSVAISPSAGDFSLLASTFCSTPPFVLTVGQAVKCNLGFTPTAAGARTATFTVTSDATGSPQTVTLNGNGLTKSLSATATLAFPNTLVGSTSPTQTLLFQSSGTAPVTVTSSTLAGANPADFTIISNACFPGPPVPPGSSCAVSITFTPGALGARGAILTLTSDGGTAAVALSGTGLAPAAFGIGGTITGLSHLGLVLANGADTVSPAASATSFVFGVKQPTGAIYNVTVKTQPIGETCTVTNGSGTVGTADVTNVSVDCVLNATANWVWKGGGSTAATGGPVSGTLGTPALGNVPGRRDAAVSWTDTAGNLWLFGGLAQDSQPAVKGINDLWRYRPASDDWTWMSGSNVGGAAGVYGTQGTAAPGNVPGARLSAFSWSDGSGNLWLFGGDSAGGGTGVLNDLWKYDIAIGQWTWLSGTSFSGKTNSAVYGTKGVADPANVPGSRKGGVTWTDAAGDLWLFGGDGFAAPAPGCLCDSSAGLLADLWKYNPSTNDWTWISGSNLADSAGGAKGVYGTKGVASPSNAPGHRRGALSWSDTAGNLWLFGGLGFDSNGASGVLNDLWKYDPTSGEWTWISGSSTVNAVAVFGTKGVPTGTNVPEARQLSISWVDKDDNLWLFGGVSPRGLLNDLWQYNIATGNWTWMSGSSDPGANGVYGTRGTPDSANVPGARNAGVSWVDAAGNLWHFGGIGFGSSPGPSDLLNDLWIYQR